MLPRLRHVADLLTAGVVGCCLFSLVALLSVFPRWTRQRHGAPRPRRLLCLVPVSLTDINAKGIFDHILQRDLAGYFDEVFSIHFPSDTSQFLKINDRHFIWEFSGRQFPWLTRYPLTNMLLSEARLLVLLAPFVRRKRICVIKAQDPYVQGLNGFVLSRLAGIPFVTLVVSNYDLSFASAKILAYPQLRFHWLEKLLARFVFRRTDMVLAMSDNNRSFAIQNGARPAIARTVRSGAAPALEHFQPLSLRTDLKAELGLGGRQVVLFIGRLSPEKYPQDVLLCAEITQGLRDDVIFLLAGDGPMREALQAEIEQKRLGHLVKILGAQSQRRIMDLCYTADAIVAPLSGISLIESALSTSPVVAYDVEWHSELVHHGKTGLLVPFRDVRKLAEAVDWILGHPEQARQMGRAARDLACRQHDTTSVLDDEKASYEQLLAS